MLYSVTGFSQTDHKKIVFDEVNPSTETILEINLLIHQKIEQERKANVI